MEYSLGDLIDRLTIVNNRIWHLEEDIRKGKEKELGLSEVGKRALMIRDLNKERVALKNAINKWDDFSFKESKINHASENET